MQNYMLRAFPCQSGHGARYTYLVLLSKKEQREKGGVIYSKIDTSTGEVESKLVSPEEFVKGIGN